MWIWGYPQNMNAMVETFYVQLHKEVKTLHLHNDCVWEDFVTHNLERKFLKKRIGEFDCGSSISLQPYSLQEANFEILYA